jgi:methylated-DNA-[protein]-cysteine S-methyltransferase
MSALLEVADLPSPIGAFRVAYEDHRVRVVDLIENGLPQSGTPPGALRRRPPFPSGSPPRQIAEYFRGDRTTFDLEVDPESGSLFDRKVWSALMAVPAGRTVTYAELARKAGYSGAARAVGGAMARNPIPILIPCHRVVGAGGAITGYGLGLWRKRWLLAHEHAWPLRSRSAEGPRPGGQRTLDERPPPARRGRAKAPA